MRTSKLLLFGMLLVVQAALFAGCTRFSHDSQAEALATRLSDGLKWRTHVAVKGTSVARNHGFNAKAYTRYTFSQLTSDDQHEWQHEGTVISSADEKRLRIDFERVLFLGDKLRVWATQDRFNSSAPGAILFSEDGPPADWPCALPQRRGCTEALEYGSFMQGYLQGMQGNDLPALLANASRLEILKETSNVDGTSCQVLRAETRFGRIDLWIPEGDGCMPLRMTIRREQHHLCDEKTIADIGAQETITEIVFDEMTTFGEYQVPLCGRLNASSTLPDGQKKSVECEVHFTSVDIDPDFEALGAFATTFPDGTQLLDVSSGERRRFTIRDGQRIPVRDTRLPADIRQSIRDFKVTP